MQHHLILSRVRRAVPYLGVPCLIVITAEAALCDPLTSIYCHAGDNDDDAFGYSVASVRDFNLDGFDDVVVGAPLAEPGGRAYVLLGGAALGSTIELFPSDPTTHFGGAVASGGSFAHPTEVTTIVCEQNRLVSFFRAGNPTPYLEILKQPMNQAFAEAVAAGDWNGDGFDDVAVGSPGTPFHANPGSAYVYLGGSPPDTIPDHVFNGTVPTGRFGTSVAFLDWNGDGFSDLVIASPFTPGGVVPRAGIYLGGAEPDTTADLLFSNQGLASPFGYPVASAGRFDGDRFDDLLIGTGSADHRAYLFSGGLGVPGQGGDSLPDLLFQTDAGAEAFGFSLAGAGDMNGDGFDDVVSGAHAYDAVRGRILVYCGGQPPDADADFVVVGEEDSSAFGVAVSAAGDFNNNELDDIAVGAIDTNGSSPNPGTVCILGLSVSGVLSDGLLSEPQMVVFPNPAVRRADAEVSFALNLEEGSETAVRLHAISGQLVRVLLGQRLGRDRVQFLWDGLDSRGNRAPDGVYLLSSRNGTRTISARLVLTR